jgi:hypothetical protein
MVVDLVSVFVIQELCHRAAHKNLKLIYKISILYTQLRESKNHRAYRKNISNLFSYTLLKERLG